jgi:methionyl-tRNA formyltransferase
MGEVRPLAVAYLGNAALSVPPLAAVAASRHDVGLVLTRSPRPGRRGGPDVPTPVAAEARRLGLPLVEVETIRTGPGFEALADAAPDVVVVVAYGELLPAPVLRLPSIAPVNLHFSLLPALRGASPVQTALLRGFERTGVTTIVMDEGLDTGDVLLGRTEAIRADDDAGSLGQRLARIGGGVLVETLDLLSTGRARPTPQDGSAASFAPKLGPDDRRLVWARPAVELANLVRAMAPEPGATATFRGAAVKILRARAVPRGPHASPGEVVATDREGFSVATGDGALRIAELAPAGRSRMPASAFVNGFRPRTGERWS